MNLDEIKSAKQVLNFSPLISSLMPVSFFPFFFYPNLIRLITNAVKAARIVRLENPEPPKIGPTQIKGKDYGVVIIKIKPPKPFLNGRTRCPVT